MTRRTLLASTSGIAIAAMLAQPRSAKELMRLAVRSLSDWPQSINCEWQAIHADAMAAITRAFTMPVEAIKAEPVSTATEMRMIAEERGIDLGPWATRRG